MKKHLVILTVVTMIFVTGCASYKNMESTKLNSRFSNTTFTATFINKSSQPIFIDFKDGANDVPLDFRQVNPGKTLTYKSRTYKDVKYTIAWWHEYGFESEEKKVRLERTGMYTGKSIVIDDLFLRNKVLQGGVVINCTSEPVKVWDSQGTQYGILQSGEASNITLLIPTPTTFYWTSVENVSKWQLQHRAIKFTLNIDAKDNQYWQGKSIGWKVEILKSR